MRCRGCGQELGEDVKVCPICKMEQIEVPLVQTQVIEESCNQQKEEILQAQDFGKQKSRLVAGLLQLFFGGFGLGRFYLGYTGVAVGQLCTLPLLGIGYIWGFIDGILILCGQLDLDAEGIPLK